MSSSSVASDYWDRYCYIASIVMSVLRTMEPRHAKTVEDPETAENTHQLKHIRSESLPTGSMGDVQGQPQSDRGGAPAGLGGSSSTPTLRVDCSTRSNSHPITATPRASPSDSHSQPPRRPSVRSTFAVSPLTPPAVSPVTSSGNLGSPISGSGVYQQNTVEQHMAEAAMVTDGYRQPSGPEFQSLPPYTPGPSRQFMDGHGNESNEMRLSEYVKGQTRAQNMKGAGGGM